MRHRHPDHVRSSLLAQPAAQMRYQLNPAEAALWAELNAGKLGVAFRRQVVVLGRYIADFLAPSVKLIVEVDGGCHARRVSADARRDEKLGRMGLTVLRLPDALVLGNLLEAVRRVREALAHCQ